MADGSGPVVAGTDFSETSALALAEARRLALRLGAQVQVVHVVDGPEGAVDAGWQLPAGGSEWLRLAGVRPEDLVVRFGSGWVELARYVADASPALVVVGSHGQSGYQPLALGSTAVRLSLQARCPVVVVSPRSTSAAVVAGSQDRRTEGARRADALAGARGRAT